MWSTPYLVAKPKIAPLSVPSHRALQDQDAWMVTFTATGLRPAGVDWGAVEDFVDLRVHLQGFAKIEQEEHKSSPQKCARKLCPLDRLPVCSLYVRTALCTY